MIRSLKAAALVVIVVSCTSPATMSTASAGPTSTLRNQSAPAAPPSSPQQTTSVPPAAAAPTTTAIPSGGGDPRDAVVLLLPGSPLPCGGTRDDELYRRARGCPITMRLEERLHSPAVAGLNPICRCQSYAPMDIGAASVSNATATGPVTLLEPNPRLITFGLVRESSAWRVDD